ncbi:DUF4870 domain-containing protein [uncultured Lacinutrix sp.]|uniref:DUF4870 domain-containing protein n=1 Tax=uncultured Lacinutrix sp. TaxID=574032 RepID=UPI002620060D|nr:DUF4870 domain-containing protein [uncultured Lacinutrix sp.]
MKEDRSLLVITHLSQLVTLIVGFGSLIVPLVVWLTKRDEIYRMDAHGKSIVNFQLSLIVYCIICVPLILLFGLGLLGFIVLGLIAIIFPIVNAIKVSNGEEPHYPLSFNFIS